MRTRYLRYITFGFAVVGLIAGGIIIIHSRLNALETTTNGQANLLTTSLDINVLEDGQPGLGLLLINGDCPEKSLPSQAGAFHCDLVAQSGAANYSIRSINFQSFTNKTVYSLPIFPKSSEPHSLTVKPNKRISLLVTINQGQIQLEQFDGTNYVSFDPATGFK